MKTLTGLAGARPMKPPLNISLIAPGKGRLAGLLPVMSMDIFGGNGDFHPQGLYSSEIFGRPGEHERMIKHSFIDMKTLVIHPKLFIELGKLKALYKGIMAGTAYAIWDPKEKDFVRSDIVDGQTGYSFFMDRFPELKLQRNRSGGRDLRIDLIEKYQEDAMYRYLIVLPAGLREVSEDTSGRPVEDDINGLYRRVLRIANSISIHGSVTSPALDVVRWNLQVAFNEVYDYLENILKGKKGFLLDKWASRNIHGGTRNVITALDAAPAVLGSENAFNESDTMVGLHQYVKGTVDRTLYMLHNGVLSGILDNTRGDVPVVDRKTLKSKTITPSNKTREKFGTEEGLKKLLNGYGKEKVRHHPVVVDGDYAALIYKDDVSFKVFFDIDDLPDRLDRDNVSPLTWTEWLYLDVFMGSRETAATVTRYPMTNDEGIYPTNIYLMVTTLSDDRHELDDDWQINEDRHFYNFPRRDSPFFDSLGLHPNKEVGLGADHDGDKTSLNIVTSIEANDEVSAYLDSKSTYLDPRGSLRWGLNGTMEVSKLVLQNFTQGMNK